jgi:myosin heavy subunit
MVLSQLQYTGTLATLLIRRKGFPQRQLHKEFYNRYRIISPSQPDAKALVQFFQTTGIKVTEYNEDLGKDEQVMKVYTGRTEGARGEMIFGLERVLMKDFVVRQLEEVRGLMYEKWYNEVKRVCKAAAYSQPYQALKLMCKAASPAVQLLIGASKEAHHCENTVSQANLESTIAFNEANISLMATEAHERKLMQAEEAYSIKLVEGRFMTNINKEKQKHMIDAEAALEKGREFARKIDALIEEQQRVHAAPIVEESAADSAAVPHHQKVVRYFPLVRKRNIPKPASKPNYKFTYNFDIKPQVAKIG